MGHFNDLTDLLTKIQVSDNKGKPIEFAKALTKTVALVNGLRRNGNKVIFIGNGGSASIASHISTDFLKNADISSIAFNDSSLLTCISNDLGYERVFEKPIGILSKKGDILFSISSSGKSKNILNAAKKAKQRGCFVITLSGFNSANPLRKTGDINFYAPSNSYGNTELAHMAICHLIADIVCCVKNG